MNTNEDELTDLKYRGEKLLYNIKRMMDGKARISGMIFGVYAEWTQNVIDFAQGLKNLDLEDICREAYKVRILDPKKLEIEEYAKPELLGMKEGINKILEALNKLPVSDKTKKEKYNNSEDASLKTETEPLVYHTDGGIYFNGKLIKMRSQIKTLCILFMQNHGKPLDYTAIKNELINPRKKGQKGFKNMEKYVSELHKLLKGYFKKKVIFNHEKEAYIFDMGENS